MSDALRRRVLDHLAECHVMTLATCGGDGPWAAAVFYVADGFTLHFLSSPKSRHCRNLAHDPRVAATIQLDYRDWPQIRGVQLEGAAVEVADDALARVKRLYADRFEVMRRLAQAPAALAEALAKVRWYSVVPERLYFVDNSAGFGRRDEVDLAA
jgi:uncharacterized protein YhbP (UPF0306 family)